MKKENKIILILLIAVIISIIVFLFLNSKEKEKAEDSKKQTATYTYGRQPFTNEELNINNPEIKKMYSYVYPSHFFLSVNNLGKVIPLSETLFDNKPVKVANLSSNYRYSLIYSQFDKQKEITAQDFALANTYLLADLEIPVSFFCYDSLKIGTVQLISGVYRFLGRSYPVDGVASGGDYVLVDVKQRDDKSIELYEAEYTNNDYEISSDKDDLKIFGKNNQVVASIPIKKINDDPNVINNLVIKNASKFKQHKIIFSYIPNVGYFLYGTEPVL